MADVPPTNDSVPAGGGHRGRWTEVNREEGHCWVKKKKKKEPNYFKWRLLIPHGGTKHPSWIIICPISVHHTDMRRVHPLYLRHCCFSVQARLQIQVYSDAIAGPLWCHKGHKSRNWLLDPLSVFTSLAFAVASFCLGSVIALDHWSPGMRIDYLWKDVICSLTISKPDCANVQRSSKCDYVAPESTLLSCRIHKN